jgi:hypothetical protein
MTYVPRIALRREAGTPRRATTEETLSPSVTFCHVTAFCAGAAEGNGDAASAAVTVKTKNAAIKRLS